MTRAQRFKNRATLGLVLTGIGIAAFFFVGMASQQPAGWGAAYAFADPVTVQLRSNCDSMVVVGRGGSGRASATCEAVQWTVDGKFRAGTLYTYADEIDRGGSGGPTYKGEARALGDRAYGKPELWITIVHLTALGVAALGLVVVLFAALAAAVPGRARRA
ncbi:hypothetical protein [Streptomyces sp. TBY4]|uniref:hypothetical protein n=1 Tax=Streptomyces sp. TBY4 TaxID=2962030 RepID=UPI0020B7CBAD|nr:hypothetical protein [Streptomyces sp. TBY4]MCP3760003.1 hypothetical protein [Streptomyces sp. TBY4]